MYFVTLLTPEIFTAERERSSARLRGKPPSTSLGLAMSVLGFLSHDPVSVLMADDDPLVCRLAQSILAQDGYLILTAFDGHYASDVAGAHPGPLHLLLSFVYL